MDEDEQEEGREMDESITGGLRKYVANYEYASTNYVRRFADRIDARFAAEMTAKQDEIDGLKADVADLQARLDASMPLPVDADGVPCRIGDLLETEEHIPRKAVGYYLADESTPCVTLDFVSPSIEASLLHHVAPEPPEPPDSQERIDADARKWTCEYFDHPTAECDDCPVHNDMTPCRALATLDLLRRQRELDGAGGQA